MKDSDSKPVAVTPADFAAAEKLMEFTLTESERALAAASWPGMMRGLYERRQGPRKVVLGSNLAPFSIGNSALADERIAARQNRFIRTDRDPGPVPTDDARIALAPLWKLSRWMESREITSERLCDIYLKRIEVFDRSLRSVITLTRDLAFAQAAQADREIASGFYRGPLHGIPWGAKDILDTASILTTYGAEAFSSRVPQADAVVVRRLHEAGAVLMAKLSLGALALNDVWFGGQTMNPWLPEEGAGGSSAGSAAATAAGLVGFAIGSETEGSIVNPCVRCGVAGLRPTFGRVPRTGAMTLAWSLDKLGPITRSVEDAMLVLQAMSGPDTGDSASVPCRLDFNAKDSIGGLRVGYFPAWMRETPATDVDRAALQRIEELGLRPVEVTLPDWPYQCLRIILFAEAAAAFEGLTLSRRIDSLRMQTRDAWPNMMRQSRFVSAVDLVQADRFRRAVATEMQRIFSKVDLLLVPSLRNEMLTISNFTGHPSLTLRAGFVEIEQARSDWESDPGAEPTVFSPSRRVPHGVTLIGKLFDEGTIARVGLALERDLQICDETPRGFEGR